MLTIRIEQIYLTHHSFGWSKKRSDKQQTMP